MSELSITTIDFHGDQLVAIEREGDVLVAMKPLVEAIGLQWHAQRKRIQRDPVLSKGASVMDAPSSGGMQDMICLHLELLHGWLFTIDSSRVKDDAVRARVVLYQRECYRVLHRHFSQEAPEIVEPEMLETVVQQLPAMLALDTPDDFERYRVGMQFVKEARMTFGPGAARRAWKIAGLPAVVEDNDAVAVSHYPPGPVEAWFAERVERVQGVRTSMKTLFADYEFWCDENDQDRTSITSFGRRLTALGIRGFNSNGIKREGVRLRQSITEFG